MMYTIINFLRRAFPFLLTLFLWRLSGWFWNPGGILALIPVFFCTFFLDIPWFGLFGVIFCFLIDYKFDTLCFWTALFCLFYAVDGFQNIIDLTRMDKNAIAAFMLLTGIGIAILTIVNFSFIILLHGVWTFFWTVLLYVPITTLIQRVRND